MTRLTESWLTFWLKIRKTWGNTDNRIRGLFRYFNWNYWILLFLPLYATKPWAVLYRSSSSTALAIGLQHSTAFHSLVLFSATSLFTLFKGILLKRLELASSPLFSAKVSNWSYRKYHTAFYSKGSIWLPPYKSGQQLLPRHSAVTNMSSLTILTTSSHYIVLLHSTISTISSLAFLTTSSHCILQQRISPLFSPHHQTAF